MCIFTFIIDNKLSTFTCPSQIQPNGISMKKVKMIKVIQKHLILYVWNSEQKKTKKFAMYIMQIMFVCKMVWKVIMAEQIMYKFFFWKSTYRVLVHTIINISTSIYTWRANFQNLINPLLMKIEFLTSLYRITFRASNRVKFRSR